MATSRQDGLDPNGARTPQTFMRLLLQARNESGLSIVEIVERARERGYDLDAVGLNRALASSTLPPWQVVTGVLAACGMGGMQIDRWMRVYHDLATPARMAASVTAVLKPIEFLEPAVAEPVSVPPLVLTPASAKPARRGRRNVTIAAAALAAVVMLPLLLFALFNGGPGTVAAEATSAAPRTAVTAPTPSPSDLPVAQLSPTGTAAPTTPVPVKTTVKPPPRTSAPPSASPRPSPSPADPGVLRSGVAALTGIQAFDLDSGQTVGVHDIYRQSGTTLVRLNRSLLEPMPGMPGKQACQAEQGWETWVGNLRVGQWLCVRTSDGRYGRLNITAVGDTLKLAYTIWT